MELDRLLQGLYSELLYLPTHTYGHAILYWMFLCSGGYNRRWRNAAQNENEVYFPGDLAVNKRLERDRGYICSGSRWREWVIQLVYGTAPSAWLVQRRQSGLGGTAGTLQISARFSTDRGRHVSQVDRMICDRSSRSIQLNALTQRRQPAGGRGGGTRPYYTHANLRWMIKRKTYSGF